MKKKPVLYTELAYFLGILLLALGNSLIEKAALGMSMVVAPAYILHLWISEYLPFFSFGMAGYVFQAGLLLVLILITRRARISYLFSFVTAVIFGFVLDLCMLIVSPIAAVELWVRILIFLSGMVLSTAGIAFLFHTYLLPEVYELFTKELVRKYGWELFRVKTAYDISSFVLAILMSLVIFGGFVGIGVGTVVCAFLNGFLIASFDKLYK